MARDLFAQQPESAGRNLFEPVPDLNQLEAPAAGGAESPVIGGRFSGFPTGPKPLAAKVPEIGSAPELNELSVPAFRASYGLLATGDDERLKSVFQEQFGENVNFTQDEEGNTIVNLPSGQYALNKPGLSAQDIARGLFDIAAFTPAGRATTIPRAIGAAAGTEAAIEAGGAGVGAGFDAADVATTAALGGVGKLGEDIASSAFRAYRGRVTPEQQALMQRAEQADIPLMTTDVIPPETLAGRLARSTGEVIPVAGTGGQRASQQQAREELVESFATQYKPQYDEVVQGLKRQTSKVSKAAGKRLGDIKTQMDEVGEIPTNRTIEIIDDEIDKLTAPGRVADDATVGKLQEYRDALTEGQNFESLDTLRSDFREQVKGDRQVMPNRSQAATNRIYEAMTGDLDEAVASNLGDQAANKWKSAKAAYAKQADKVKNTKIKNILQKGDLTPEQAGQMLFSQKPSEIKALYQSLDTKGKQAARATVIAKAIDNASKRVGGLTPNSLASEMGKFKNQYKEVFKGADRKQVEGMIELLNATRRAQDAKVATPTGQALLGPLGGYAAFTDLGATLGTGLSLGGFARAYESKPVRNALLRLANTPKGSSKYDDALQKASEAVRTYLVSQPEEE